VELSLFGKSSERGEAQVIDRVDAVERVRENARDVARVFDRTADALEQSARLAALHADRQQRAGRTDLALKERHAAMRAGEAAGRARLHAAEFDALAAGDAARRRGPRPVRSSG
jgi:hypothetical protein